MNQIWYLFFLAIVEIIGDFAFERYANTGSLNAFSLGVIGYIGVVYFLIKSLRGSTILYVNGMWDAISSVVESLLAFVYLGERFDRPIQYVGLLLTIIGLFCLKSNS